MLSEMIYFKVCKSQIPAIETAARMLGSDKLRAYCLEMICADFLADAHLDNGNPEILLNSISGYYRVLPNPQKQEFLSQIASYLALHRQIFERDKLTTPILGEHAEPPGPSAHISEPYGRRCIGNTQCQEASCQHVQSARCRPRCVLTVELLHRDRHVPAGIDFRRILRGSSPTRALSSTTQVGPTIHQEFAGQGVQHMTRFLSLSRGGLLAALLLVGFASTLHAQTITTFDPPNSHYTTPVAINDFGQITGAFADADGFHGFLREPDGTTIHFDVPKTDAFEGTFATAINAHGQITGFSSNSHFVSHSFLRQPDGTMIVFRVDPPCCEILASPTATDPGGLERDDGDGAYAINAVGQIAGDFGGPLSSYGFLREHHGTIIKFNISQSGSFPLVHPRSINLFGQIAGFYSDANGWRGFLRQPRGAIIKFDAPGAIYTFALAINFWGEIAGYFIDADGIRHGFLRKRNGQKVTFDPDGSSYTEATSINFLGEITGFYADASGTSHGFLRKPNGIMESFDAPGAANAGTFPKGINDLGQIVGYYQDANFVLHGFIRSAR
jgi:uncharacterized membrane protein